MSAVRTDAELKGLRSRKVQLEAEIEQAGAELREANAAQAQRRERLAAILKQIADLEFVNRDVTITEHALLRYLERARGIDLEAVKKEMLSPRVEAAIRNLGTCNIATDNGVKLVVKGRAVVSVVPA